VQLALIKERGDMVAQVQASTVEDGKAKAIDIVNSADLSEETKGKLLDNVERLYREIEFTKKELAKTGKKPIFSGTMLGAEHGLPMIFTFENEATGRGGDVFVNSHEMTQATLFTRLREREGDLVAMAIKFKDYTDKRYKGAKDVIAMVVRSYSGQYEYNIDEERVITWA